MVQLMPQPFKHPKTGVYYYRKVIPPTLRKALGGKTEFRISLGTKEIAKAKRLYLQKAEQVEAELERAASGPVQVAELSDAEIGHLVAVYVHHSLEDDDEVRFDGSAEEDNLFRSLRQQVLEAGGTSNFSNDDAIAEAGLSNRAYQKRRETLEIVRTAYKDALARGDITVIANAVEELLEREGVSIKKSAEAYRRLSFAVLKAAVTTNELLIARQNGEVVETPPPPLAAPSILTTKPIKAGRSVSELFDLYADERALADKTRYSWPRILKKLTDHIGHDDASRIIDTDIIGWKDVLVASGLKPRTIKNHLIVAKSFFRWAAKNKRIASNPAIEVEYKPKHNPANDRQSYSDDDARCILLAARDEREAHKRWVPWLAAFSGARCDELCGAMASDVKTEDGVSMIRIDPANRERGASVKNRSSIRSIPLHSAVILEGFLDYVASLPTDGPLFPHLKADRFGKRGGNGSKSVGRWVRRLGITDARKAPNHSWRHRFADQCRRFGVPRDIRFAIEGRAGFTVASRSAAKDVGDRYGSDGYPLSVLAEQLEKLPNPVGDRQPAVNPCADRPARVQ